MELATRRVQVAGITPHPTAACMPQWARPLTDPFDGFLFGKRSRIHERDPTYTPAFSALLKGSGSEPIVFPPRSPHLNAHCARFVRSMKEDALDRMGILGEGGLHHLSRQSLMPSHTERHPQGLGHGRIAPARATEVESGRVVRRARLGGLLSYYYRDAA